MAHPDTYRPQTKDIPLDPGVYRFLDAEGRVIYVGKAKSLRGRLPAYFANPDTLHPRTHRMVFSAAQVVWVVVNSEIEALTLEYAWIKEFAPRFNVMYRDDKSYPYVAVTTGEEFPRLLITRAKQRPQNQYFGPYTRATAAREAVDLLQRVFKVRSCTKGVFNRAQRTARPCLNGYIDRCTAPCVGRVEKAEYQQQVQELLEYLHGDGEKLRAELQREMEAAAAQLDFEQAAKTRDQLQALASIAEQNTLVMKKDIDADVFGIARDELEVSVQVFYVRSGRIRGQKGWVSEIGEESQEDLLNQLILQVYGELSLREKQNTFRQREQPRSVDDVAYTSAQAIPQEIWLPGEPRQLEDLQNWLSELRGAKVHIKVPQRGKKFKLVETVNMNALQALNHHKLQRSVDLTARSQALEELRQGLNMDRAPLRIECYDISHTQGTNQVASMVVFEDGLPKKKDYRHFVIRGENGAGGVDDTAAMAEVLERRMHNLEKEDASFRFRPDLIVVDGGLPQVNAASKIITDPDIKIVGLAKRLEEVWIPGSDFPLILPRSSPALHLLQYLRDESHRFAITHHRKRRAKSMTRSQLDAIAGLGEVKQKELLRYFGSVQKIKAARPAELAQVAGIGAKMAEIIFQHFHPEDSPLPPGE